MSYPPAADVYLFVCLFVYVYSISLLSPDWPGPHDVPASGSQMPRLHAQTPHSTQLPDPLVGTEWKNPGREQSTFFLKNYCKVETKVEMNKDQEFQVDGSPALVYTAPHIHLLVLQVE